MGIGESMIKLIFAREIAKDVVKETKGEKVCDSCGGIILIKREESA